MERPNAQSHRIGGRLRVERQDLSKLVQDRPCHHRHPLEWPPVFRSARPTRQSNSFMKGRTITPVRCAIYTRVSTDQGLEQDFNSLDAQYEAAEAYIRSQAHAGWTLIRSKYDDG